ncbi:MFS transporter [Falsiroseomonas tokyonensis]|uniref:MFS transporter n=1 Tax=Falsiroseomonas tokyonensis TaxID=430521 RepID=A0ABV7BNI5_9PROT|nr:MFS transporter [Falsiroseomonas tokyonensis]MBU8537153.1 MFS transporter [Falsiroseomonas tokyonensis]
MAEPPDRQLPDRQSLDRGATRRLILVLGLACLASNLATRALDPLVGVLARDFMASPATIALLSTAFALPYALVQPVLGPVGDAVGKRRVIRICLIALAVALALAAAAPDLTALTLLRILAGAAAGGIFPLAIAAIGDHVPMERRQVALSRLLVAGLTGSSGGALLSAALEPWIGWRGVTLVCAAAALAALPMLRDDRARPEPRGPRLNLGDALRRYRHIIAQPAARVLYACVFLEGMLIFGIFPFIAPLLAERGQGGVAEAGFAVAAFGIGGFIFAALAGLLLRRMGQSRMVLLGGGLAGIGLGLQAVAPVAAVLVAGCLLLGLGFYMMHSSIQTRVTEVAPMARGSAVALHAFSFFLGQSLGPAAMGAGRAGLGPEWALAGAGIGVVGLGIWLARRGR